MPPDSSSPADRTMPSIVRTRAERTSALRSSDDEGLSIAEMLRVLDVARQLRDERESAEVALRRDDIRAEIKRKLTQTAELTGEQVTEAEIDAAIEQYFQNLHTFHEPPRSVQTLLAHVYVRRQRIIVWTLLSIVGVVGVWYVFLSGQAAGP